MKIKIKRGNIPNKRQGSGGIVKKNAARPQAQGICLPLDLANRDVHHPRSGAIIR